MSPHVDLVLFGHVDTEALDSVRQGLGSVHMMASVQPIMGPRLSGPAACTFRYSLTFLSASDEGVFDDYVYNARLGKEAGSLQHWRSVAGGMRRLSDFHTWLHADHLCYAVPRQHEFGQRTIKDPKLLESY